MNSHTESGPAVQPLWHRYQRADVVVVGAGIAGLALALRLPATLNTIVVTKGALGESNTRYAQGGLAAAVGQDDDPDLHFHDTMAAGAGLCDPVAVRELVEGGPAAVQWLLDHGTRFDEEDHHLALGKEAAHSRNRVLHAGGDATGAEIERALVAQLRSREAVTILEHTAAIDLVTDASGRCSGVIVRNDTDPERTLLAAPTVVLANGGAGQLWAVTSNPEGATGDGIAMALRAGVVVADLEFTQFHPTVLTGVGIEPFLVSEAVRGEGAYLRDQHGNRFMVDIHPLAELAPRDVVARAIQRQIGLQNGGPVFLDLRHLPPDLVAHRFPTISQHLAANGLDLARDLIPVAPAAHYFMGGIVADTAGRTSLPGLYAVGEVSCTGVHGANRLASNSLLEGLVFGLNAADAIAVSFQENTILIKDAPPVRVAALEADLASETIDRLQETMSLHVAVVRNEAGLTTALNTVSQYASLGGGIPTSDQTSALRSMVDLDTEIIRSATERKESRGGHYRDDYPETDPALDGLHQLVTLDNGSINRRFGTLAEVIRPNPVPVG